MSYEHRGLVIGIKQKLLYVLPIFSYDPAKHPDVYHHIDNPASKSDMFLLKGSEFSFINHDSVLKFYKNTFQVFTMTTISFSKRQFHWKNSKKKMMLP